MRRGIWAAALLVAGCSGIQEKVGEVDAGAAESSVLGDPCAVGGGKPACPPDIKAPSNVYPTQVVCFREHTPLAREDMYGRCTVLCGYTAETDVTCAWLGGECVQPFESDAWTPRVCVPKE
jgi:hypothetical protein